MSVVLSKCAECRYLRTKKIDDGLICDAYPKGIPLDVFKSAESVRCSDNISFEQCEEEENSKVK